MKCKHDIAIILPPIKTTHGIYSRNNTDFYYKIQFELCEDAIESERGSKKGRYFAFIRAKLIRIHK